MTKPKMVRVIRDTRDVTRDIEIPLEEAKRLYAQGLLAFDVTNKTYCETSHFRLVRRDWK